MKQRLKIRNIFDIGALMHLLYSDGSGETIHIPYTKSYNKLLKDIEFEWYLHTRVGKKKAIKREIYHLPYSRLVILSDINKKLLCIIIRNDKFPLLFELIENFHKGMRLVSREEKYKNLYQVYEELSVTPLDSELKVIRHSISHPRKSLTNKKTTEILLNIFGDTKIDLQKYKHAKIFKQKLLQLYNLSEQLLIKEIIEVIPTRANVFKYCFIPKSSRKNIPSLKKSSSRR